jgi:putative nucleotidyltransferase with HDIG domain
MSTLTRAYFILVAATAAALLLASHFLGGEPVVFEWGLLFCVGIGLIAEVMAVEFKIGLPGYQARSSLAFLPFICALTLFPVAAAVWAIVLVLSISQFVLRRISLLKALFNISQGALAGYAAGTVYHAIFDGSRYDVRYLPFIAGFIALALVFFLTNMLLSSVALALLKKARITLVFQQVIGTGGANLVYDLLASPIALVPVVLYRDSPVTGMFIILCPLLLFQYSYLSNQKVIERSQHIVRALVKAIETRDPHTSGHSLRVATLAKVIAADLSLPVRMMNYVEMAALLHDVGKIHPEYSYVLSKPYSLSEEEVGLIQTHAARGAELLRDIPSVPEEVVSSVYHHHERYDGKGYPAGLVGADIPLPARIIMLCDSVDAMLSDRPYRKALSIAQVRAEVERCRGSQFDPHIVDVFLRKNTLERAVHLVKADASTDSWGHVIWA